MKVSNCTYYYILKRKGRPQGENEEEQKIENNPGEQSNPDEVKKKGINHALSDYTKNTLSSKQHSHIMLHLSSHLMFKDSLCL